MARCGCAQGCACAVQSQDTDTVDMTVTGVGSADNPYVVSAEVVLLPDGESPLISGGPNMLKSSAGGLYVAESEPDLFIYKSANESVTSSTVLQNDDELFAPLQANKRYVAEMQLFPYGAAAGDIKVLLTGPAGYAMAGYMHYFDTALAAYQSAFFNHLGTSAGGSLSCGITTSSLEVSWRGIILTGASSGDWRLQWAQVVSNATPTVVPLGSWMRLVEV